MGSVLSFLAILSSRRKPKRDLQQIVLLQSATSASIVASLVVVVTLTPRFRSMSLDDSSTRCAVSP